MSEHEGRGSIADRINAAVEAQRLTGHTAYKVWGLERSFLARLCAGKRPPRTRSRTYASEDARYQQLAEAMGLTDLERRQFISDVESAQLRPTESEHPNALQDIVAEIWPKVAAELPSARHQSLLGLVRIFVAAVLRPRALDELVTMCMQLGPSNALYVSGHGRAPRVDFFLGGVPVKPPAGFFDAAATAAMASRSARSAQVAVSLAELFYALDTRDFSPEDLQAFGQQVAELSTR